MSCGQGGDLDQVVGEDPLSGPGFRSFEAVQAGAVPAVSAFEGADPAFASGSPFDGAAKCWAFLDLLAGGTGSALARDHDSADTQVGEVVFDGGFAVPAVSGHRPGRATGPGSDPLDRRGQLWCVGGVSDMQLVIHDDAVVVVDNLALVAEFDGFTQPALGDRAGIAVVQADHPGRAIGSPPGDPLPGLLGDLGGGFQQGRQVIDGAGQPTASAPPAASRTPAWASCAALACARRSARRALPSRRCASRVAAWARSASSPVTRCTPSLTWSRPSWLRDRSFAAIPCARFPAARERSRSRVRTAPPALWIRAPAAPIRRIALASNPESVG